MADTILTTPAPAPEPDDLGALVRARGMLVSVEITAWSARKLDRRVTRDATERHAADADAGRFNKHLLGGKVASYNAIIAAIGRARALVHDETLPWGDEGTRLLSTANYFDFAAKIRAAREEVYGLVDAFVREYGELVDAARFRLGDMYEPRDYPPAEVVRRKFRFRVHFSAVPAGSDLRLDLPPHVVEHMQRSIAARVERTIDAAVRSGWDRLYASVERLRDKLVDILRAEHEPDGPTRRLHASLFDNAIETARTLRRLNVLQDPKLDAMADRIIAEVSALDPSALRRDPDAMLDAARATSAILTDLAGIYGGPDAEGAE